MRRPVTHEELQEVELRTKGETTTLRRWPAEVIEAWLAAEVIRRGDERPALRRGRQQAK
ncbi:MAG: hypothetical protein ACRD9R_07225 [Pyrinomonadaceae bacterium]